MYERLISTGRYICRALIPILASVTAFSCIRDDRDVCYDREEEELLLYVKIVDVETGRDITGSGGIEEVILALFDAGGRFITTYILDGAQISARRPIVFADFEVEGVQVSAWGDIGGDIVRNDPHGHELGHDFMTLAVDGDGYSGSPSDFFFGFRTLSTPTRAVGRDEVVLTQKNSKLHVTARGLEDYNEEKYYFVIDSPANGYGFSGVPNGEPCRVRQTGKFESGQLVSPEPYLMIHSAGMQSSGPDDGVVVNLFRTSGDGDVLLASASRDRDGNMIELHPGMTTNVLIELGGGGIEMYIEITGWRQVYQWPLW
ncbi:MAG: FimB/Mfa2 family fimbrial subunit [Rikenellaceae bacterium]|nr:FimB/Mfa2 family fimbrial subunit [Rikenellaceae bacterium]